MTEPLPDAEWWPLDWQPDTEEHWGHADFTIRGKQYSVGHMPEYGGAGPLRYNVYTNHFFCEDDYERLACGIPDLLALRCFLLKLAYPGGQYG